jgi:hypothetical protein
VIRKIGGFSGKKNLTTGAKQLDHSREIGWPIGVIRAALGG